VTTPTARLLITTCNNEMLVGLGAEEHRVEVLSLNDALKMLAEWVGQRSVDKLPPEATEVAKECGYLPLALAMIGAMIRLQPTAWKDALDCLCASDLEDIRQAFPGDPYPNLLRAIEVASAFKTQSNCTGRSSDSNARRPYRLGHCRGSHTRWPPRGLRLRGSYAARLGPGIPSIWVSLILEKRFNYYYI